MEWGKMKQRLLGNKVIPKLKIGVSVKIAQGVRDDRSANGWSEYLSFVLWIPTSKFKQYLALRFWKNYIFKILGKWEWAGTSLSKTHRKSMSNLHLTSNEWHLPTFQCLSILRARTFFLKVPTNVYLEWLQKGEAAAQEFVAAVRLQLLHGHNPLAIHVS